jgi:predicted  nucleic acid-binding Zn-ribbon protein
LQRRQSSLEDSLIEVMEHREQLQNQHAAEKAVIERLQSDLDAAQQALDTTLADIDHHRRVHSSRRDELTAELTADLLALYERQRSGGGPGAALLQGGRCGACRIEIDRGELARISAAADDEVLRCPECSAILLRAKASSR